MAAPSQPPQVRHLATELGECRQRGLDRLDVDTPPQSPVQVPTLEQLAADYCTHAAPTVHGRIAAIKRLLRDTLDAYQQAGNPADAQLITELFFPDPTATPTPNPGQLLDQARKRRGISDEKKFRDDRRRAFLSFAEFLTTFSRESAAAAAKRRHRRRTITAAAVAVVLAAVGLAGWWLSNPSPHNPGKEGGAATASDDAPQTTTTTNPPPPPGSTHPETVNAPANARTYRNPRNLTGEGPRIDNHTTVQVSCKITATSATSAGRYWYRIVDPPWNNQYYSPANSYLNGDPPAGPYTHDVDPAVPDCPP